MTDHEVLYVERIVHCECGWRGDAEGYDQHQIDATLSETVGEFERLMRGHHKITDALNAEPCPTVSAEIGTGTLVCGYDEGHPGPHEFMTQGDRAKWRWRPPAFGPNTIHEGWDR